MGENTGFHCFKLCLLFGFAILTISSASADFTVYKGNSVVLEDANSTIEWGRNYTFNATRITTYNRTLEIGDRNISIYSNSSAQINSTLWKYNLSQPEYGDTLIKGETAAVPNSTVHFQFNKLPSISEGQYSLEAEGNVLKQVDSGGEVAWSYSDWSRHNFTVTYEEQSTSGGDNGGDDSDSGGGGSYVSAGCEEAEKPDSHSWSLVNRSSFSFEDIDPAIGIQSVEVNTNARRAEFAVCAGTVENISARDFEKPADTYVVYQLKVDEGSETAIESATIRFEVNTSFAKRYDHIVLSRYQNGWEDLDTTVIDSSGEKRIYEATTSGFSYYAVRGENQAENQSTGSTNWTSPDCGNSVCSSTENWNSCQQDCSKPRNVTKAEQAISNAEQQISKNEPDHQLLQQAQQQFEDGNYAEAEKLANKALNQGQKGSSLPVFLITGLVLVTLLVVAGYFGRSYWKKRQVQVEIKNIKQEVHANVKNDQVDDPRRVLSEIDRVEKAMKIGDYSRAKKYLNKIK